MNDNQEFVPELRFKGFTDAWVQRKLGELADVTKLAGFEFTEYVIYSDNGEIIALRGLNVKNGELILDDVKYIDNSDFSKLNRSKLYINDILFTYVGTIGQLAVVPENDKYYLAPNVARIRLNSEDDPQFISQQMSNSRFYDNVIYPLIATSSQPALSMENVRKFRIYIPSNKEQIAIGGFFRTLDNSITLNQRKLDGLRELKKGYLQQMFPQAGEYVPRIRFAGFSGEWDERRLCEISEKVTEKNKNNEYTETFTNSAEYGIISQRDFFDKDISNAKNLDGYFIVRPDDFVYNPRISSFAPVGPIKRNLLGRTGVMSPLYYVFRIKEGDHTFIEKYFETVYWHEFMKFNGDNGVRADRFNIKDSVLGEMPIPFPSLSEQVAIGNFFHNLDKQIAAQAQKTIYLKQLKYTYLQKMFI